MSTAGLQSRHDHADQRRLAELGCPPMQWRRRAMPARPRLRNLVLVSDEANPGGVLADLLRGLALAGHVAQMLPKPATAGAADSLTLHFGLAPPEAADAMKSNPSAVLLPSVAELRGNAGAKRAAWQALRAALR